MTRIPKKVHERSCRINPKNKEAAAAAAARIAATDADAVDGGGDGDSDCIYPAPNVGWKGLKEHALRQKLHQIPCAVSAENAGRGKRAKAFKGVGKVLRTQDATVNHFTFSLSQKAFRNYKMLYVEQVHTHTCTRLPVCLARVVFFARIDSLSMRVCVCSHARFCVCARVRVRVRVC